MATADQVDLAFNAGFEAALDWAEAGYSRRSGALPSEEAMAAFRAVNADRHVLDTQELVCFYEQDFYPLSNFSAFSIEWEGHRFATVEHAYHWEKFRHLKPSEDGWSLAIDVMTAPSAHVAFKLASAGIRYRRPDWDEVKVGIMHRLLRAKVEQHEYVRRKLLATGDRELVENSWRDDFWGWGPNRDGKNVLGRLWMAVRAELRGEPVTAFEV